MKRTIERRIERLESLVENMSSAGEASLSDEQWARIDEHIDAMVASLGDEQRAELERAARRSDDEPADAETDQFGLTDAERASLDVLTGGHP